MPGVQFLLLAAFFGLLLNWLMVLGFVAWFPLSIVMGTFTADAT